MVFFVMAASIMAICIISIYKIARKMGGDLSLSALVMCGISALIINFMAIQTNPFLTKAYYYILGSMIIFAASGVTCYNKYLLYRHNQPAAHGAIHDSMNIAADDAIAESEERAEEKPAEDMLFSSAEEPASNEAETDAQPALGESAPAEAVTDEQPATSEPASTEAVTEAEPAAETLTDDTPASKAASPISETEPRPEAAETAKAAEAFEPEKAMLKAAEHIASAKEAEAEPISDTLEKAETEPVIESKAKAAPAVQKNEAVPEGKPAAEAEAVDANAESISKAPNSSDAESESGTDADIADSETAPAMPETGQKDAPQQEPAKAVLPDGLESMDDLLDFAFAQASAEHYAMALLAYSTALEKYRHDDYAPFIIIDMVNLYKSQGQYQAAIDCINEAMDIPAIKANPAYQQNFQNYLAQIESISHSAASPKVP